MPNGDPCAWPGRSRPSAVCRCAGWGVARPRPETATPQRHLGNPTSNARNLWMRREGVPSRRVQSESRNRVRPARQRGSGGYARAHGSHSTAEDRCQRVAVDGASLIDEIVREGARRMLAAALEAEVDAYIAAHAGELDERGRRLVVRNGHAEPRQVLTCGRRGGGDGAAGERQARRRGHRVSGSGSPRRSCRRGAARPRRSPRCCRCCTCTACPAGTSCRRWRGSSAPAPGCRRR